MEKILKPKFYIKKQENNTGENKNEHHFILEKLERGFGHTLGNALRRTALSSILGASAFAIEIKGVQHEFQSIENCSEDALELILKIKELIIEFDEKVINLEEIYEFKLKSKKGKVFFKDLIVPEGLKIINQDFELAETAEDDALDLTIYISISKGSRTFEENNLFVEKKLGSRIGLIAMDSIFNPIKNFNFNVEIVNPGEIKEFEKLNLLIETKGNMTPEKVLTISASLLKNYFMSFEELHEFKMDDFFEEESINLEEEKEENLSIPIETLNFSVRSENALKTAQIKTVEELVDRTVSSLNEIKNLGEKSKNEIIQTIQDLGLSFKSE